MEFDKVSMTRAVSLSGGLAVTPRPLQAYCDMFLLSDDEIRAGPILDCPAGASPFGAQVRARGGEVVSVDPVYEQAAGLVARAFADVDRIVEWQRANPDGFDWSYLGSPEAMGGSWTAAVEEFAADFVFDGTRYVAAALPALPFPDDRFAMAVSGFLLFVYPELLSFDNHRDALLELARVTRGEVRIYPLHDTNGEPYAPLADLRVALDDRGVSTQIRSTGCAYSPRPGSDRMLVCRKSGPAMGGSA